MSGVASIRIAKIKTKTTISRTEIHNERKEGDKTGKHIDKNRSYENEMLIGSANDDFYRKALENIMGKKFTDEEWEKNKHNFTDKSNIKLQNGRSVRSDAVIMMEAIMNYPGAMLLDVENNTRYPEDKDAFEKWKKDSVEFIQNKFGKENVINAVLHMDESTPHIHAVFTPTYINEKGEIGLSSKKYVDGKAGCSRLQTEYAKAVGYERGIEKQKIDYDNINRARAILTQSIGSELPEVEKRESAEEYRERANPEYEKVKVKCDVAEAEARKLKKFRKENADLIKQNEQLKQETEQAKQRMQQMEFELKRVKQKEELEKIGMEQSNNDQDLLRTYTELQEMFVELGKKHMMERGFDIIDMDNDGIDDRITGYKDENHNGTNDRFEDLDENDIDID